MGIEHTITEFYSNALSEVSGHEFNSHSTNFVQLLQFHLWLSVQISFWTLPLSVVTFTTIGVLQAITQVQEKKKALSPFVLFWENENELWKFYLQIFSESKG